MIRVATYEEWNYIHSYANQVLIESTKKNVQVTNSPVLPIYRNLLMSQQAYYLVDIENGIIRGWILLGKQHDILDNRENGYLFELYVLHQYRNLGIAKKLLEHAVNQLVAQGYKCVKLNVFSENEAKYLYKKLGFIEEQIQMKWEKT